MEADARENRPGPAQIRLAGLEIRVDGWEFPEVSDGADSDWLTATVRCEAEGASVQANGAIVRASEIATWADQAEQLHKTLTADVRLRCTEPHLHVHLRATPRGRVRMTVGITPNPACQRHVFEFDIDQSYLPGFVDGCRRVLREYPLRAQRPH